MTTTTPLTHQSATSLAAQMQAGQLRCTDVLEAHLSRIDQLNPALNAIVTLTADSARARAERLDQVPVQQRATMPLFGLPVAHKDLVPTAGVRTTQGSTIFADHIPTEDSLLVQRFHAAGAVMVGKTNTPEFGAGSQTFNAVFGATCNPYDHTRTCGGSSGGAATALASRMLPIADGSDLGGSLRNPAAFCNVVGLRPSMGRVPTWPSINGWNSLATDGPMARSVADVALVLSAMAGPDARAPLCLDTPGEDFHPNNVSENLQGKRFAFSPDFGGQLPVEPGIVTTLNALIPVLKDLGATVETTSFDFSDADEVFDTLRAWQFAARLGDLVAKHPKACKDTVVWNVKRGQALTAAQIAHAEQQRTDLYLRLQQFMQSYDALLLPTTQVQPFAIDQEYVTEINGVAQHSYLDWMKSCCRITVTGHPCVSLPAGFHQQLPVGVQIVGRFRDDKTLLGIAQTIEQATNFANQLPPEFG